MILTIAQHQPWTTVKWSAFLHDAAVVCQRSPLLLCGDTLGDGPLLSSQQISVRHSDGLDAPFLLRRMTQPVPDFTVFQINEAQFAALAVALAVLAAHHHPLSVSVELSDPDALSSALSQLSACTAVLGAPVTVNVRDDTLRPPQDHW